MKKILFLIVNLLVLNLLCVDKNELINKLNKKLNKKHEALNVIMAKTVEFQQKLGERFQEIRLSNIEKKQKKQSFFNIQQMYSEITQLILSIKNFDTKIRRLINVIELLENTNYEDHNMLVFEVGKIKDDVKSNLNFDILNEKLETIVQYFT